MSPRPCARPFGFTLIELVITVAIVGVLALMAMPLLEVAAQRQKEAELRTSLRQIREAIDAYHQAVQEKRIESPADASGYPPNLEILVDGAPDITKPTGRRSTSCGGCRATDEPGQGTDTGAELGQAELCQPAECAGFGRGCVRRLFAVRRRGAERRALPEL